MDMESDMGDGDMSKMKIFGSTNKIHPSLHRPELEESTGRNKPK
jgi:hypothetical protein